MIPGLFSVVFYIAFALYMFFAMYVTSANSKSLLNRLFLMMCITLGIWSFAYSIAISAPSISTSILWSKIGVFGWGAFYSVLLHFMLVLTHQKKLYQNKFLLGAIYFPVFIFITIYAIYTPIANQHYQLTASIYGWVNTAEQTPWDIFFQIYFVTFVSLCSIILYKWARVDTQNRKAASKIFIAVLIATISGTLIDIVLNQYVGIDTPQIGAILIMIPTISVFKSMNKYNFMNIIHTKNSELILNEKSRKSFYNYIFRVFLLIAIILLILWAFSDHKNIEMVYMAVILVVAALMIKYLNLKKISSFHKDNLLIMILFFLIPFVTLGSVDYSSVTIWALPFSMIIAFIVFNNYRTLIILAISILSTQLIVWTYVPEQTVLITHRELGFRILLYIVAIFEAFYVNKVYVRRLKDNVSKMNLQKLVTDISNKFATVTAQNFTEKITETLYSIGTFFNVDRAVIFLIDFKEDDFYIKEWHSDLMKKSMPASELNNNPIVIKWIKHLKKETTTVIDDLNNSEIKDLLNLDFLLSQGDQSLMVQAIISNGNLLGFLELSTANCCHNWTDNHEHLLNVFSNTISNTIDRIKSERIQHQLAYYDQLTGLPNRQYFSEKAHEYIKAAAHDATLSVLFLDLDGFKVINDTMGHEAGDQLLITVSEKLQACIDDHHIISRFGGDEFLILIHDLKVNELKALAQEVINVFKEPFRINDHEFFTTASVGVSNYPNDGETIQQLIKNADVAMYEAKALGKNQYIISSNTLKEKVSKTLELSNSMYRALDFKEFELYYQPQIELDSGKIIGLEALIRWHHYEYGLLGPNLFIDVAESTGQIIPIGDWVIQTACEKKVELENLGFKGIRMSVNLSVVQFKSKYFVDRVKAIIDQTGVNPHELEFEITESIIIEDTEYVNHILKQFKALGICISIDDFGTGYSSLSRLKDFPLDRLKMDMQFVQNLELGEKDRGIAQIIIDMANHFDMSVIAEGVETQAQLDILTSMACKEVQGYFFYKPIPNDDLESIIRAHPH